MADDVDPSCPFCGRVELLMMEDDGKNYVLCLECKCCGPCVDSKEEAMLSWCERYEDDEDIYLRSRRLVAFGS